MTDLLVKLYAGLTDQERGKMAYIYSLQGNELEQKRISSVMPEQHFVGLPDGYRRMFGNLNYLALLYAMEYWKQVAICVSFLARTTALLHDDDLEAYKPIMKRFECEEGLLLSLEQAFDAVCAEHGLDRNLMRFMAGKQFYKVATPGLELDDVYLKGMTEVFNITMA